MTIYRCGGYGQIVRLNDVVDVLSVLYRFGDDSFSFIEAFLVQWYTCARFYKYCVIFSLCFFGSI